MNMKALSMVHIGGYKMKLLIAGVIFISSVCQANDLIISEAKVRAVPPTQKISAAFMTLENRADQPITIISANTPSASATELHTNIDNDGKMQMRKIDQLVIPGNSQLSLKPGGMHIMLIGLTGPLNMGENIDLTLGFSDGQEQRIKVPVEMIQPMHHKMQH
jgi:periplasmic copper chaperone A